MPCPFLSRLSANYVRNYAEPLLQTYGSQCPVIARSIFSTPAADTPQVTGATNTTPQAPAAPKVATAATATTQVRKLASMQQQQPKLVDEIDSEAKHSASGAFPYEEFFHEQILRKKQDHSYR